MMLTRAADAHSDNTLKRRQTQLA